MKQSINPTIWGPHGWKFMHYVSLGYPENPTQNDKHSYKNFYYSLQDVLPCEKCKYNYLTNITENPIDSHLDTKDSLVKWVIDIHNTVNKELGKKELTYEEAINIYLTATYEQQGEGNSILDYCFKIIVLLLLLYFLYIVLKK